MPPFNGSGDLPFLKCLDGSPWKGGLSYKDTAATPDFTTPNERYWSFVDKFLSYCDSQKITVFIFPGYLGAGGGKEGWMLELVTNGPSKIEAYGKFIATRYKNQKNLVWMLLGDMGTSFTDPQKAAEAALIKGLKSVPGQQSKYYSAEANSGQNSKDQPDFGNEMTLNGVYDWEGKIAILGRKAYAEKPPIPSFLLEEPYDEEGPDGNQVNPGAIQPVRRFQWTGWLSSLGGYISGNGYVWGFRSPDWQNHLDTKGAKQMSLLNSFIHSIEWWNLVPSGLNGTKNIITTGGGLPADAGYVAAAADIQGRLLVAYIPPSHKGSIEVDLTTMHGSINAEWYDPTSGSIIKIAGSPLASKGLHQFVAPSVNGDGQADWVLVLKAKGN